MPQPPICSRSPALEAAGSSSPRDAPSPIQARSAPRRRAASRPSAGRASRASGGPCRPTPPSEACRSEGRLGRDRGGAMPTHARAQRGSLAASRCPHARREPGGSVPRGRGCPGAAQKPALAPRQLLSPRYQRLQPRPLASVPAHRVAVDAQGEARVGVAELGHHGNRVLARGDQDRGERVAQLVGTKALREGDVAALFEQPVGSLEDGVQQDPGGCRCCGGGPSPWGRRDRRGRSRRHGPCEPRECREGLEAW